MNILNTGPVEFSTPVRYKEAKLNAKINGNRCKAWG
jgi:hypothetical protein